LKKLKLLGFKEKETYYSWKVRTNQKIFIEVGNLAAIFNQKIFVNENKR
jgi:hypothetical protein